MCERDEIERIHKRLEALEDERAIRDVLTSYGFAVDSNDADATAALFQDQCVIELNGTETLHGHDGVRSVVNGDVHQSLLPNCAHLIGPVTLDIQESRASATGYMVVVLKTAVGFGIWRQGVGRWDLERTDGRWRIIRRTSLPVGGAPSQELLNQALRTPGA